MFINFSLFSEIFKNIIDNTFQCCRNNRLPLQGRKTASELLYHNLSHRIRLCNYGILASDT